MKAYLLTVQSVTMNPALFAQEFHRRLPMNKLEGERFRALSIWISVLSAMVIFLALMLPDWVQQSSKLVDIVATLLAGCLSVYIFACQITRFSSAMQFEMESRGLSEIQNYAAAPLALTPLFTIVFILAILIATMQPQLAPVLQLTVLILGICGACLLGFVTVRLVSIAARYSRSRTNRLIVYVPFRWFLATIFSMVCASLIMGGLAAETVSLNGKNRSLHFILRSPAFFIPLLTS